MSNEKDSKAKSVSCTRFGKRFITTVDNGDGTCKQVVTELTEEKTDKLIKALLGYKKKETKK